MAIDFALMQDGHVQGLAVRAASAEPALDRPAYASMAATDLFRLLPGEFTGPYLRLRSLVSYNPDEADLEIAGNRGGSSPGIDWPENHKNLSRRL